jgi:hypothetical protein
MNIIQTNFKYRKPLIPLDLNKVEYIVLHHPAWIKASPEEIHNDVLNDPNKITWNGFPYNAYIRKDGTVFIGRGMNIGSQCTNYNSRSYGICCEGDYSKETSMPQAQFSALVDFIKSLKPKLPNLKGVKGHYELDPGTTCPEKYFPLDKVKMAVSVQYPILRRGNFGEDVKFLQTALIKHGYKLIADGDFGPATDKAVRDFQVKNKLGVDGVVGPFSWRCLL